MHGIKRDDFYKNAEENEAFKNKLEKGYKLLDLFVDYCSRMQTNTMIDSILKQISDSDSKIFYLSTGLIDFMPEFTPSWNYRKKYILKAKSKDRAELIDSLVNERLVTQKVLKENPKSFTIWHHRLWTMTCLFNLRVDNILELLLEDYKLCFKLFKFDGRNFHCWSYLNFIRHYIKLLNTKTDVDKLTSEDILNLINEKFSNYSAWFHKSNLTDEHISTKDDLELVKQVLYTEPKDQSLCNYYNWLLFKRNTLDHFVIYTSYLNEKSQLNIYFNSPVRLGTSHSNLYKKDDLKLNGKWTVLNSKFSFGYIWSFQFESNNDLDSLSRMELLILLNNRTNIQYHSHLLSNPVYMSDKNESDKHYDYTSLVERHKLKLVYYFNENKQIDLENFKVFEVDQNQNWVETNNFNKPFNLRNELVCLGSGITLDILKQQLDVIDELISFDGESKYLLIAKLKLSDYLNVDLDAEYLYNKLSVLDPYRKNYYSEAIVKHRARSRIRSSTCSLNLDLSNLSLSNFEFNNFSTQFGFTHLDLSKNKLTYSSISNIASFLLLLESLDLSDNGLKSLVEVVKSIANLTRLKRLNLSNNPLEVMKIDYVLDSQISEIDLTDTPISTILSSKQLEGTLEGNLIFGSYKVKLASDNEAGKSKLYLYK